MLKKKLVGSRPAVAVANSRQQPSKPGLKKRLPPKPADEDEEDEDLEDEVDEDEAEVEEVETEEEEEEKTATPAKVGVGAKKKGAVPLQKKRTGLASAFDRIPLTNNAADIAAGKYEAIIKDMVLQEPDSKGQSVRIHFELCDPQFSEANNITQWFKIVDDQGESVDGGIRALKQTLAMLGYEPSGEELEECFEQIGEEKPGVVVKVSYSQDKNGNTWQRASVQGLCDNDVVQEYKDNVPY